MSFITVDRAFSHHGYRLPLTAICSITIQVYPGTLVSRLQCGTTYSEQSFMDVESTEGRFFGSPDTSGDLKDAALDKSNQIRVAARAHLGVNLFGIRSC
jgi:hypothetical protein